MKRDMDLIRKIVLKIEASTPAELNQQRMTIEGHSMQEVGYHCHLLNEAGFVTSKRSGKDGGIPYVIPIDLTWKGHEFVDAARQPSRWQKAKEQLGDKVSSVPFAVLQALLTKLAMKEFNLE